MSFPVVVARLPGLQELQLTSHYIPIPSGQRYELILVTFTSLNNVTIDVATGSGWKKVGQLNRVSNVTGAIFYKIADGNDELVLSTSSAQRSAWVVHRIAGGLGVSGTPVDHGGSANINPPEHDTGIERDYLWIATYHSYDSVPTAIPSDFNNPMYAAGVSESDAPVVMTAERLLKADKLDPGIFTASGTNSRVAWTIAVEPVENVVTAQLKPVVAATAKPNVIRPRSAALSATSEISSDPSLSARSVVNGLLDSFKRQDHDWRMMSVSVYTHREIHYETRMIEDRPKIVERVVTRTTEIYAIESDPLGAGVSIQVEAVDGKVKSMTLHYLGGSYEIFDSELLALLRQKGRQASLDLQAHMLDVLYSDPVIEDEGADE